MRTLGIALLLGATSCLAQITVIDGATLIDGNGGTPVADSVIVVDGARILAIGPRASVHVPANSNVIDARTRYVIPGLIDTNVHLSLYGGMKERYESLVRYAPREREIVLEAAQIYLKFGVTTVRDSYGLLLPLTRVRDEIAGGRAIGARILAAGNIVGWGGPYSITFSLTPDRDLTLFQEQMNDEVSQGAGDHCDSSASRSVSRPVGGTGATSPVTTTRLLTFTACGCGFSVSGPRRIAGSSTESSVEDQGRVCTTVRLWHGVAALPVGFFTTPA